jgi:hypothetical protein
MRSEAVCRHAINFEISNYSTPRYPMYLHDRKLRSKESEGEGPPILPWLRRGDIKRPSKKKKGAARKDSANDDNSNAASKDHRRE